MQNLRYLLIANANGGNFSRKDFELTKGLLSIAEGKMSGEAVITETLSELEYTVDKLKGEEINIVGIFGGDGTIMQTRSMIEKVWDYRPMYICYGGGTMNNLQRALGRKNWYSASKYLAEAAALGEELHTTSLASFDLNGKKGFNIGFGLPPKFLWLYYKHSAEKYMQLEQQLRDAKPEEHGRLYREATNEQEENPLDPLPKRGLPGILKTALAAGKFLRAVAHPHSYEACLLSAGMTSPILIYDSKDSEPFELREKNLGVYISSYQEINFGLPILNPKPFPKHMVEASGKMPVLIPRGNIMDLLRQFPLLVRGKTLPYATYLHADMIKVSEQIAQIDGELVAGNGFTVKYDGEANFITPPSKMVKT